MDTGDAHFGSWGPSALGAIMFTTRWRGVVDGDVTLVMEVAGLSLPNMVSAATLRIPSWGVSPGDLDIFLQNKT